LRISANFSGVGKCGHIGELTKQKYLTIYRENSHSEKNERKKKMKEAKTEKKYLMIKFSQKEVKILCQIKKKIKKKLKDEFLRFFICFLILLRQKK